MGGYTSVFTSTWDNMMTENMLFPGHNLISPFLCPSTPPQLPKSLLVSARNLEIDCLESVISDMHPDNPNQDTWLRRYHKEKKGILDHDVYGVISQDKYRRLCREKNAPKSTPTMLCLVFKYDGYCNMHCSKIRIVVLRNHEDCHFDKSQQFAPVLSYSSLGITTSNAADKIIILQQDNCKNSFWNALLPEDDITTVRPPIGNNNSYPDTLWLMKKTLYSMRRSP